MCYGITYDCTVTCINTNLNATKLAEGVITSTMSNGYGCRIVCEEGEYIREHAVEMWNVGGFNPVPLIGMGLITIGLIILAYLYLDWKAKSP